MKINLLMPTIGRVDEIYKFISSINYKGEVVLSIADQNDINYLSLNSIKSINPGIKIDYHHSKQKGLSHNRNSLLENINVSAEIVAFPDDDCMYYDDTLERVRNFFIVNKNVDVVIGAIYDRATKECLFKSWPKKKKILNRFNCYFMASSITIFAKNNSLGLFDEKLGAGTQNGSCEDPDFLYRLLKSKKVIVYEPSIQVWHPAPDFFNISLKKTYSYSKGFGYFIRKDFDIFKLFLLLLLLAKKTLQLIFKKSKFPSGYFTSYFSGLFDGLKKK